MSSETSMMAADFRLREWATQIRGCQSRPAGIKMYTQNVLVITLGNYRYVGIFY